MNTYEEGQSEMREACARLCDDADKSTHPADLADAIRALPINEQPAQEPFGYFRAMPFGWEDCAETDVGAVALYEAPPDISAEVERLRALNVERILLDVVPGDGNGLEVYAKSVSDVEAKLSELSEKAEEVDSLRFTVKRLTAERDEMKKKLDKLVDALVEQSAVDVLIESRRQIEAEGWTPEWRKPSTPRRDLVKAGALILAEIERIDLAAAKEGGAA